MVQADSSDTLFIFDDTDSVSGKPDRYTAKFSDLKNVDYAQDIKLRKQFSWATFGLLSVWLVVVALLLAFSSRSDSVMVALISGATIQVIGLYYIVLRYIFPERSQVSNNNQD